MKFNCTISDFQIGDMVAVKKGWTFANTKYGFVEDITIAPPRINVRHSAIEVKKYKPEELKNITGGIP